MQISFPAVFPVGQATPGPGTGSFSYMPRSIFPTQTFVKGRGIGVTTLVAANQTGGKAIRPVRATKDSIRLAFPPTSGGSGGIFHRQERSPEPHQPSRTFVFYCDNFFVSFCSSCAVVY